MEFLNGYMRWENITTKAYNCKSELDRKRINKSSDYSERIYKEFLEEKYKNPTIASTAMQDVFVIHPMQHPYYFRANLVEMSQNPTIKNLEETVTDRIEKLYPKTHLLRTSLIQNDRINLYDVTPKLSGLRKFLLKLKTIL